MHPKLILASKSPRRKQLLELAEIDFEIITEDTNEDFPSHLPTAEIPIYIALQKANAIFIKHADRKIIAADTVVVLNNEIIGKPISEENAIEILQKLSGNVHQVITGVVIKYSNKEISFSETTEVTFNPLTKDEIIHYVTNYKPYDKAGAYAIQEWIGAVAIASIKGCFFNVMGLPISKVVEMLKK
jgi:septum formation protein